MSQPLDTLVLGAGISGLSYAHARLARRPDAGLLVLEASGRPGGLMRTERGGPGDEYRFECGPEAITASNDAVRDLFEELALPIEELPASTVHRWVVRNGKLAPVPTSPPAFLKSGLLSPLGKLRAASEPFRSAEHLDGSVADFIAHRVGREVLERMVDPMIAGIHAGDPRELSARAVFPRLVELVERHGSLLKGMRAGRRGPPPKLMRPEGGIESLAHALAERVGERLRLDCGVHSLRRVNSTWVARTEREEFEAQRIVLALPAGAAARLLTACDDEELAACGRLLAGQPTESLACVVHAWDRSRVAHPLDGFGYLVPSAETAGAPAVLGTLFSSSVSPSSAPTGRVLLRTMMGGSRDRSACERGDAALLEEAVEAARPLLGLEGSPAWHDVRRWPGALPSYDLDHVERLAGLRARLPAGLDLLGNYTDGIGISALVERSRALAGSHAG